MSDHPAARTGYTERDPFHEQVESLTDEDGTVNALAVLSLKPSGEPENIESLASDLRKHGENVSETGYDIKSSWGGLSTCYKAPDHEDALYAAMDSVADDGDDVDSGTSRAASALETFAGELASIQSRFDTLYEDVSAFRDRIDDDPDWRKGDWFGFTKSDEVQENEDLRQRGLNLLQEYAEAEVACASAINDGVPNGTEFTAMPKNADDGDLDEDVYYHGYDGTVDEMADEWGLEGASTDHNWVVDSLSAGWDHTVNFVEGVGGFVGAHSSEGWFEMSAGDAITEYHRDNIAELAGLVGLYDRESDSFGLTDWGTVGESWKELAHSVVPWTEWEERPGYVVTTAVLNTVGVVGGAALTATGVGAVVGVPLMAWRGASMLDGMGSGPAAGGGGLDGGSSGGSTPTIPTGAGGGGQTPTFDASDLRAPEPDFSPGQLADLQNSISEMGAGGQGNEGGAPRAPITPASEVSDSQRSGRGGGSGQSGRGTTDERSATRPVGNDGADGPVDNAGDTGRSESRTDGPADTASDNRWGIDEDTSTDNRESSRTTPDDETGSGTRENERTGATSPTEADGTRSERADQNDNTNGADTRSQTRATPAAPDPARTGVAENGTRTTSDSSATGGDTARTDTKDTGQNGSGDQGTRATRDETGHVGERVGDDSSSRGDGDDAGNGHRDEAGSDLPADALMRDASDTQQRSGNDSDGTARRDDSQVRPAGHRDVHPSVRDDHPAADLKRGHDAFDQLVDAYNRESATGVGSQSPEFQRKEAEFRQQHTPHLENPSFGQKNPALDAAMRENPDFFEKMRSSAENDPLFRAQNLAETPTPRSGWDQDGARNGGEDAGGGSNSGNSSDPRFDGPSRETVGASIKAAAANAMIRLNNISGNRADGSRVERAGRSDSSSPGQSHNRWGAGSKAKVVAMEQRGGQVDNSVGSRGGQDSGGHGSGGQSERGQSGATERTGGPANERTGDNGGPGDKSSTPPTGGPGTPGDTGNGGNGPEGSGTRSSSAERWSSKTPEERRRAAEPFLKDLDMSSWNAFKNDFLDRLNVKGSQLAEIYYRDDASRRSKDDSIGDWSIPMVEKTSTGKFVLRTGEIETNSVKYLGSKIRTYVDQTSRGARDTLMAALDHVMRKRSDAYTLHRPLNDNVQERKIAFGEKSPEVQEARKFRAPWADKATKLSELVGEIAGHRAVTHHFDGTNKLTYEKTVTGRDGVVRTEIRERELPRLKPDTDANPNPIPASDNAPGSGADQFDMIYRTEGGGYVIVEAKSNQSTDLGHRTVGEGNNKRKIKQGTNEYFFDTLNMMVERGGAERRLAKDIMKQFDEGMVFYVEAKGKHEGVNYEGESLRFFDLEED